MTAPAVQEQQDLAELIQSLAYAQGPETVMVVLGKFAGVAEEAVELLFSIPQVRGLVRLSPRAGAHAATHAVYRLNVMRRASYLVQASRRLTTAKRGGQEALSRALVVERRWLQAHLAAQAQRQTVGDQVAAVARRQERQAKKDQTDWNGLLGWYAVNDERTSSECRKADGRNFDPKQVPLIGFPGSVHVHCRCKPGPPLATNLRVESVKPERRDRVSSRA